MTKTVIGFEKNDFRTKDGKEISGYNVYLSDDIEETKGLGCRVERVYLSDSKIAANGIDLDSLYEHEVAISYNRWGKVDEIIVK